MKIQCNHCGHLKTIDKAFIIDLFGLSSPAIGFTAWTSYLFAGTGFAMPLCAAIAIGGPLLLTYKNEILESIANKKYICSNCGEKDWGAVSDTVNSIKSKMSGENSSYDVDSNNLAKMPENHQEEVLNITIDNNIVSSDKHSEELTPSNQSGMNHFLKRCERILIKHGLQTKITPDISPILIKGWDNHMNKINTKTKYNLGNHDKSWVNIKKKK